MSTLEKGYQYGVAEEEATPLIPYQDKEDTSLITTHTQKQEEEESGVSFGCEQEDEKEAEISFGRQLLGELVGTCMLTQVGCAALCANTYLGLFGGLWQIAFVWFLAAMLAISAAASISGAHLNPAVTVSDVHFLNYARYFKHIIPLIWKCF